MTESVDSQIVVGEAKSFSKVERKRRGLLDSDKFLDAVRKTLTLSDTRLADYLGVARTTVWRYRTNPDNAPVIEGAKAYLGTFFTEGVPPSKMTYEYFQALPHIRRWKEAMDRRMVSGGKQKRGMRAFYHVCRHLNRFPSKITAEECAKLVVDQRTRYYSDKPPIPKLAYSSIREPIRNFFMSVHNMSGLYLKNLGIGTEALKGSGKYSRQRIPQDVRHRFEEIMIEKTKATGDIKFFEALGNCKFNFSTGTRISASLAFNFRKHGYNLAEGKWIFEIWDKGSRGKKKRWEKILMGDLLGHFKRYCSTRFEVALEDLESQLPFATDHLYPSFMRYNGTPYCDKIREIIKPALIEAGIPYSDFPPTHIWRHTFAQDGLRATSYNYELVASLGGWVNTRILKEHYGQMGETDREQGLLRMMGVNIPQEVHELRW